MNSYIIKYNRFIICMLAIAPVIAFISFKAVHMEFEFIMRALSFMGLGLILFFKTRYSSVKLPKYLFYYLLFIIYVYFSTFVLLDREFRVKYLVSDPLVGTFTFMFVIENVYINAKNYNFIIKSSKIILAAAVLVIIYQDVFNASFFVRDDLHIFTEVTAWGDTQNRLLSIYSWIGGYLAIGFGFTPVFLILVEHLQINKKKILIWVIAGVIFAFLSKARWIMVNTLLVFILLILHSENKKNQIIKLLVIVPIFFTSSVFLLETIGVNAKGIIEDRILESNKKTKSASTRLLAFKAFDKVFWDNPILGRGSLKYGMGGTGKHDYELQKVLGKKSAQIHVGYLALLYRYGLIGGGLFLTFTFLLLKRLFKNAKFTKIWAPFLGILGFALGNMTQVHFALFQVGLLLALVIDRYHYNRINIALEDD